MCRAGGNGKWAKGGYLSLLYFAHNVPIPQRYASAK